MDHFNVVVVIIVQVDLQDYSQKKDLERTKQVSIRIVHDFIKDDLSRDNEVGQGEVVNEGEPFWVTIAVHAYEEVSIWSSRDGWRIYKNFGIFIENTV